MSRQILKSGIEPLLERIQMFWQVEGEQGVKTRFQKAIHLNNKINNRISVFIYLFTNPETH